MRSANAALLPNQAVDNRQKVGVRTEITVRAQEAHIYKAVNHGLQTLSGRRARCDKFNPDTPTRTHRSFPHAERHPITTRERSFRDQSSVSLFDADGRNTRTPHKPVDCRSRNRPEESQASSVLTDRTKPSRDRKISTQKSQMDTQAGSRRMVLLPRPRTQSHVTLASATNHMNRNGKLSCFAPLTLVSQSQRSAPTGG